MELIIYQPTDDQFITDIKFNDEEIKKELAIRLEKYNGLVYSEENIKEPKPTGQASTSLRMPSKLGAKRLKSNA